MSEEILLKILDCLERIESKLPNKRASSYISVDDPRIAKFNEVWNEYPSKLGRSLALKHFCNTVKTDEDFQNIKIALKNYKLSDRFKKGFIQNGSTWFNNWRDWFGLNIIDPKQAEIDRKNRWKEEGLSSCHGSRVDKYEDGSKRCASCLQIQ